MSIDLSRLTHALKMCRLNKDEKAGKICEGETPQKAGHFVEVIGLLLIFFGIGLVYGIFSGNDSDTTYAASADTSKAYQAASREFAETADILRTAQFEISRPSLMIRQEVGTRYVSSKAPAGFVYLIVAWDYKGIAAMPVSAFPPPTIGLLDAVDSENYPDLGATGSYAAEINLPREVFSDLIPGEIVKNAYVFTVPEKQYAEGGWRLQIKADQDIFIKIN